MGKALYVIYDMSKSMSSASNIEAVKDLHTKLCDMPLKAKLDKVVFYTTFNKKTIIVDRVWRPSAENAEGISYVYNVLKELISNELSKKDKNLIVIVSDGYWCVEDREALDKLVKSVEDSTLIIETVVEFCLERNISAPLSLYLADASIIESEIATFFGESAK